MPYLCPTDHTALTQDTDYGYSCRRCGSILTVDDVLHVRHPSARVLMQLETKAQSPAFAEACACPDCSTLMAPWRLGRAEVFAYGCAGCGWFWFRKGALPTLLRQAQQNSLERAVRTMPEADRRELARELAASEKRELSLSPLHRLLAAVGLPVVSNVSRRRAPLLTWALALLLIVSYLVQVNRGATGPALAELAYYSDQPTLWTAIRAVFLHGGLWHLLGNVYFLLAFGDAVEQRVPRISILGAFIGLGALTLVIQGMTSSAPTFIVGASGGVAVLIGACVVLQPQARVTTGLGFGALTFTVSMITYGVLELLYQVLMSALGGSGVAWVAHLSGLALGLALGTIVRAASAPREGLMPIGGG